MSFSRVSFKTSLRCCSSSNLRFWSLKNATQFSSINLLKKLWLEGVCSQAPSRSPRLHEAPKHHLWPTQNSFDKFFVRNSTCNHKRFQIYHKEIFFVTIVQFEFKNFNQTFIKNQICKISSKLSIGIGN